MKKFGFVSVIPLFIAVILFLAAVVFSRNLHTDGSNQQLQTSFAFFTSILMIDVVFLFISYTVIGVISYRAYRESAFPPAFLQKYLAGKAVETGETVKKVNGTIFGFSLVIGLLMICFFGFFIALPLYSVIGTID